MERVVIPLVSVAVVLGVAYGAHWFEESFQRKPKAGVDRFPRR